nr:PX domain-containing protein kinase-like protein [Manis javanica]
MAFMEKPAAGKVLLDDTVPLTAAIEASQSLQSHTEYIIRVQRGISVENSWQIVRRYSDFDLLNNSLQIAGLSLPLPPKKLIGNMDREFIAERQKGLQNYLNVITTNHILSNCELVKKFLDPNNYSTNYTEIALQQVSMFFRSEPKWEVVEPLKDIGWRIRKKYFLMKIKNQPKERLVLSWADLGPDKYLSDKDFQCLIKLLPSCSVSTSPSVILVLMTDPQCFLMGDHGQKSWKQSTGSEERRGREDFRSGADLGPDKYLSDKDFQCLIKLLPSCSPAESCCKVVSNFSSPSGFASVCCGTKMCICSFQVAVLESTLSCEACKNGMPTVSRLLQMPLFSDVLLTTSEKPQFKIPTKLKEALRIAKECIEKRLVEEQKQIHQHRRLTKAQSHHGSEEERKKRKILARKKSKRSAIENSEEHSAKYSNSNNSGSGASSPLTSPSSPTPPSTAGVSTLPPPPPPPPPPAASLLPASTEAPTQLPPQAMNGVSRGALLSSIQNFQKGTLRKAETCDHSAPKIG